jgi:hypothetical protein
MESTILAIHDGKDWNWRRYWIARSDLRGALTSTFLPDHPVEAYRTLPDLHKERLLILLGEPGAGKSFELEQERNRVAGLPNEGDAVIFLDGRTAIHDQTTLLRYWFDSDAWRIWRTSSDCLWVFFDGYDESKQRITNLDGIIRNEFERLRQIATGWQARLRIRIGSRSIGWDHSLGFDLHSLLNIEGDLKHKILHIAPPRLEDIRLAASVERIDENRFCQEMGHRTISALAVRPNQLRWLIEIFRDGGALPEDKVELYWDGMLRHCRDIKNDDEAEIHRAVASRIAFITKFGGYQGIWQGANHHDPPPGFISVRDLVGSTEVSNGGPIQITHELIRSTITSGLFNQLYSDRE